MENINSAKFRFNNRNKIYIEGGGRILSQN